MMPRKFLALSAMLLLVPLLAISGIRSGTIRAQEASPSAVNTEISGTIDVGMVANPQMVALSENIDAFNALYPNVTVNLTILPENEIRQVITQDIAGEAGQFDVVTIGTFEVPIWAENGWIEEVGEEVAADPDYDVEDIFQAHRDGLSYDGGLYGLPFYGESSMTFYRTDLFEAAGLEMPERPTWDQIAEFAAALHNPDEGQYGICLRMLPGWGEQLAPLTTVINAFGGRWYDEEWNAQLDSEQSAGAISFYLDLVTNYGQPGAQDSGFTECETLFEQGEVAMWYDATSAAELVSAETSSVSGSVGYAYPPTQVGPTNWLWNWSFAMASTSDQKEAALAFMEWATSKEYFQTIVERDGFGRAPTGARQSTYDDPAYAEFAGAFAGIVQTAIQESNPNQPTVDPVPYTGGQFVRIPEFQELGNSVSQLFAAAYVGDTSVEDAIAEANELANQIAEDGGYKE